MNSKHKSYYSSSSPSNSKLLKYSKSLIRYEFGVSLLLSSLTALSELVGMSPESTSSLEKKVKNENLLSSATLSLKLSTISKTAWGKDGRCYVLVSFDMNRAINMAKKVAKEEKIKYNNIKSKLEGKAYIDELDKRIKALQGFTSVNPEQN